MTCRLCLDPVKCLLIWYSLKVNKTATQLHCRGASTLVHSAICDRTCKSFRVPPFTLLHVPYSIYYNYIIITQQLVDWFWGQGKKGVCIGKKCNVAPWQYNIQKTPVATICELWHAQLHCLIQSWLLSLPQWATSPSVQWHSRSSCLHSKAPWTTVSADRVNMLLCHHVMEALTLGSLWTFLRTHYKMAE